MIRTYHYRIKDSGLCARFDAMARSANAVWNFCNQTQISALRWNKPWPGYAQLCALVAGSGKDLGLHSQTVQAICEQYVRSRQQHRRPKLRWRASGGARRALGWIPFKASALKVEGRGIYRYYGTTFRTWHSRDIPADARIKTGSIAQDATGRWFLNIVLELPEIRALPATGEVGIDLGLKSLATCSNGDALPQARFYRDMQAPLGIAQRAGKRRRVAAIHRKIRCRRQDYLHKQALKLVRENGLIVVGNVNAKAIAKTTMAKSSLDSGWSSFRDMLRDKAMTHAAIFLEVNEAFSTQTCSCCGVIPDNSPKGRAGLGIRAWTCSACGAIHDRDVNAARNILAAGHRRLAEGRVAA